MPAHILSLIVEGEDEVRLRRIMAKLKKEHGFTRRGDIPPETAVWLRRGMALVQKIRAIEKKFTQLDGSHGAAQKWRTTYHDEVPIPVSFLREIDDLLAAYEGTVKQFTKPMPKPSWVGAGDPVADELWDAWKSSKYSRFTSNASYAPTNPKHIRRQIKSLLRTGEKIARWGPEPGQAYVGDVSMPRKLFDEVIVPMSWRAPRARSPEAQAAWDWFRGMVDKATKTTVKGGGSLPAETVVYIRDVFLPFVKRELESRASKARGNEKRSLNARLRQLNKFIKDFIGDGVFTRSLQDVEPPTPPDTIPAGVVRDLVIEPLRDFRIGVEMKVDWLQAVWSYAKKAAATAQAGIETMRASGSLGRVEPIGKVGTWNLAIKLDPNRVKGEDRETLIRLAREGMPRDYVRYFIDACEIAWKMMTSKGARGLGLSPRKIAGPVILTVESGRGASGWYRQSDDTLTVNLPGVLSGRSPEAAHGALPYSYVVWTIVHEVAHRVWYRAISSQGRKFFEAFIEMQGSPLPREKRLGFARVAERRYRSKGGAHKNYRLANHIDADAREILSASSRLSSAERSLAATLWWWFQDQMPYGYGKNRPHDFFRWLKDKRHTTMLPTDYANTSPTEAWPEILASLVMSEAGVKKSLGGSNVTHPFVAAVTRKVLGQAQREGVDPVPWDVEHVLTEAQAEAGLARAVGGWARLCLLRAGA